MTPEIPADWLAERVAAARRPLKQRFKYAFNKTYKPVLDDADYRSWETMENFGNGARKTCPIGWVIAANNYGDF